MIGGAALFSVSESLGVIVDLLFLHQRAPTDPEPQFCNSLIYRQLAHVVEWI
jgi:hypothetical protein